MFKQVIVIRTDLNMGKGKMCAQAGHAVIESFLSTSKKKPAWTEAWLAEGQKKVVLQVESEEALISLFEEVKRVLPAKLVVDAGLTQIPIGTKTCLGIGPAPEPELNKFISSYRLL